MVLLCGNVRTTNPVINCDCMGCSYVDQPSDWGAVDGDCSCAGGVLHCAVIDWIAVIAGLRCAESIKGVLRCVVLYLTLAALASGGERVAVKWEWAQHKLSIFGY